MGSTNPFKDQSSSPLTKKLLPCILYALLPLALIRLYFYPLTPSLSPTNQFPHTKPPIITTATAATTFTSPSPPSSKEHHSSNTETPCDYSNGKWVPDKLGPLYNGTSCGTIKDGQNCMSHGRPDQDYLYWSWEPKDCKISRLFLDSVDERWASDMDKMDMVVLSVGHWFLHPAVYFYGESVLGCHYCVGQNYTEVGFYDVFGKAFKTTLETIMERRGAGGGGGGDSGKGIDVVVTTFSPHHFEGEWDKLGACPKTQPFKEGEKLLEGMDAEMRKAEVGEVEAAKEKAKKFSRIRLSALDVTKLSLMRPDGHPGPYMYANPFANGIAERVQNDCVHWCLPGAIDTWNEILLDVMKRWDSQSRWSGGR
ncbi:hypothetical protein CsSME_00021875 [Camellia sinensis var. sinensis]